MSTLHPQLLQKWQLLQITKASWKKGTNRESFFSVRCWAVVACVAQSSLLWRSACSNLSWLSAGLWLVGAHARDPCGNTKGLVDCKPDSDNRIVSWVLSMLKKIAQPYYSRELCFMQPTNTVELVLPVLWYGMLEYLSHSFPYMRPWMMLVEDT